MSFDSFVKEIGDYDCLQRQGTSPCDSEHLCCFSISQVLKCELLYNTGRRSHPVTPCWAQRFVWLKFYLTKSHWILTWRHRDPLLSLRFVIALIPPLLKHTTFLVLVWVCSPVSLILIRLSIDKKPSSTGNHPALAKIAKSLWVKTRVNTLTDLEKLRFLALPSVLNLPCLVILLTLYLGILEACLKAIKLPRCLVAAGSPRFALVTMGFCTIQRQGFGIVRYSPYALWG